MINKLYNVKLSSYLWVARENFKSSLLFRITRWNQPHEQ